MTMKIPASLTAAFPPSADLLFDRARREIDDAMLLDIANADYGQMADEMFALLRSIRDSGLIPKPMHPQLHEVLSLTRWCDPEQTDAPPFRPGPTGPTGHRTRLFACVLLLRASVEPESLQDDGTSDSTLAQCLASAKSVGEEMSKAVACFLTWRFSCALIEDPLFYAVALLIVAVRLRSGRVTEAELANVADWVLSVEADSQYVKWPISRAAMPTAFSLQQGFWQSLAEELRNEATTIQVDDARENVELCRLLLETA